MNDRYLWVWVLGVVVVIAIILGLWRQARSGVMTNEAVEYGQRITTDALQSPNTPTAVVPIASPKSGTSAHAAATKPTLVVSILPSIAGTTRFAALLVSTGVAAQLSGKGPYTLFVPTDASFKLLPPGALSLTPAQARRLVEYHIVSGKTIDVNALVAGTVPALSKDLLNFSVFPSDRSARVNSAVALAEYKTDNGVVYTVSEVLLPPLNTQP